MPAHLQDTEFMARALELAAMGLGRVAPNPMVGCVIVKDGKIVGEGWHMEYGSSHAEVNAVNSVKDKADLEGASVYVNLEPCSFHGHTPPCADMLAQLPIREVVISGIDPNPRVSGAGRDRIVAAGIDIREGVMKEEAEKLNRRFLTYHHKQRPWVLLKWAQTSDGFIARTDFDSKWISNEHSRKLVHKWRSEEPGIMVGSNTIQTDNPELTVRDWEGKNPRRIIVDPRSEISGSYKVLSGEESWLMTYDKDEMVGNARRISIGTEDFLANIFNYLYQEKIQSVMVEGGSLLLHSLIRSGIWDEARIFIADKEFGEGIPAPVCRIEPVSEEFIEGDRLLTYLNPENV